MSPTAFSSRSLSIAASKHGRHSNRSIKQSRQGQVNVHVADVPTEERNPASADLDALPLSDLLKLINQQDQTVPKAVAAVLPQIELAVLAGVRALRSGGRIHYFGAGTSGR